MKDWDWGTFWITVAAVTATVVVVVPVWDRVRVAITSGFNFDEGEES